MNFLFLHQNFPGQFVHISTELQKLGHRCLALIPEANNRAQQIEIVKYSFKTSETVKRHLAGTYLQSVARGTAVAQRMLELKKSGFVPDVIIAHSGWGESLFARDVWPSSRLLVYAEFFYSTSGADVGFDPEFRGDQGLMSDIKLRLRNSSLLHSLVDADLAIAPTEWQASRLPKEIAQKTQVLHEGIDTGVLKPDPSASIRLGRDRLMLTVEDEVITFVARNLEPYRGYHSFLRALPEIQRARPRSRAVIVGGDQVSYGPTLRSGSWKSYFLKEVEPNLDMARIHFVGTVNHLLLKQLLQVSAAHVYLTYPFVLSWSMLEAMSCGSLIIGSRTPPVQEIVEHERNGLLVDFFDAGDIAEAVIRALSDRQRFIPLRNAARETIVRGYDLKTVCLPKWVSLSLIGESLGC